MRHSALTAKLVAVAMVAALLASGHGGPSAPPAFATQTDSGRGGTLASRVFIVFDEDKRVPVRRVYKVWDPDPALKQDFTWTPDDPHSAVAGPVSGTGVLTWREPGRAALDESAIVSVYRGGMREGRAEGQGEFRSRDGVRYEGNWRNGLHDGQGRLQLADTTSYVGEFRAGQYDGRGTLVLPDGQTYVGPFRRGLRHGVGRTQLQSGASYESTWENDVEVEGTRHVLVAQGAPFGVIPLQFNESNIKISVSVSKTFGQLPYFARNNADAVSIIPDNKRLMAGWKSGGPISDLAGWIPSQPSDVGLLVRVKNVGSRPIVLGGGSLDIEKSREDRQPLLTSTYYAIDSCYTSPLEDTEISFANKGLGDPTSVSLVLGFIRGGEVSNPGAQAVYAKHEVPSFGFREFTGKYDFRRSLDQAGFATRQFLAWSALVQEVDDGEENAVSREILPCGSRSDAACLQKLIADGLLGRLSSAVWMEDGVLKTNLVGQFNYTWTDAEAAVRRYSAPFSHELVLGCRRYTASGAEGGRRPPPPDRDDPSWILVQLGTRGDSYTQPFPTSAVIPAGGVRDFRLQLRTPKSSQHVFRATFRSADGAEYRSKPIKLQTFIPR